MLQSNVSSNSSSFRGVLAAAATPPAVLAEERLPFTIRLVREEQDVRKAVSVRHAAYARHLPALAEKLLMPEATDFEDGVVVLLAESKLDGAPLGTMRIQTNRYKPLSIEQSVELPAWLQDRPLAEATRLGIEQGHTGALVKTVLFKAFYQYCLSSGIEWMVITARRPLDRMYERLMFSDLAAGRSYIPMRHVDNIPHRAMCLELETAAERWEEARHPLFGFMTQTHHPDIRIEVERTEAVREIKFRQPRTVRSGIGMRLPA